MKLSPKIVVLALAAILIVAGGTYLVMSTGQQAGTAVGVTGSSVSDTNVLTITKHDFSVSPSIAEAGSSIKIRAEFVLSRPLASGETLLYSIAKGTTEYGLFGNPTFRNEYAGCTSPPAAVVFVTCTLTKATLPLNIFSIEFSVPVTGNFYGDRIDITSLSNVILPNQTRKEVPASYTIVKTPSQ